MNVSCTYGTEDPPYVIPAVRCECGEYSDLRLIGNEFKCSRCRHDPSWAKSKLKHGTYYERLRARHELWVMENGLTWMDVDDERLEHVREYG